MSNNRTKNLAMLAVVVMLAVSAMPILGDADAEASSGTWTYTVSLNSDGTVTVEGSGDAVASPASAGMTKTDGTYGTGAYTSSNGTNVGDWGFDSNGYGPFGSFYAAFDASNGNKMICILNPNNLDKSIDGTITLSTDYQNSVVNIMWVLPTVYWNVDSDGKLILTNDPDAGGVAYAHTIDGHVYNYMAIGVYEASKLNNGSADILTSSTGQKPLYSQTRAQMRDLAEAQTISTVDGTNDNGHAMLWNVYMWQLYRFAVITTGGGMNSQQIFGNGDVYGGHCGTNVNATGDLDTSGPYAGYVSNPNSSGAMGTHDQSVKAFIEDAWGSLYDFVDGVMICEGKMYAVQSSTPTDTLADYSHNIIAQLPTSSGYMIAAPSSDYPAAWGLPTSTDSSIGSSNLFDFGYFDSESYYCGFFVGGSSVDFPSFAPWYGVSYLCAGLDVGFAENYIGGRLAFVYDADSASSETTHTITFETFEGTAIESMTVADGGTFDAPDDPKKSGYVFAGWYTDEKFTAKYVFTDPVKTDFTLYAKWYTVLTFNSSPSADGIFVYVTNS